MSLSIIIPTYDNVEYLDELFESIGLNNTNVPFEVLIGIDACEKTKEFIETSKFSENFIFFYFNENRGPYVIKNTLAEITKYDKILFFDSDDVMSETCIDQIDKYLDKYECIKPKFKNFKDHQGNRNFEDVPNQYGEGVFGIDKRLFLSMNGFEGWRCAADSDFMNRLYKTNRKIGLSKDILFYRRIHNNSLTKSKDTGYASSLRGKYFSMSKSKSYFGPLNELVKSDYEVLNVETNEWVSGIEQIQIESINHIDEIKQKRHELLERVFSSKNTNKSLIKPKKVIDYSKINQTTNQNTLNSLNSALKKAKLENVQKINRRR